MHQSIAGRFLKRLKFVTLFAVVALVSTTASAVSFVVTNLNDSGDGSFRKALNDARRDDTIDFAVTGTIVVHTFPLSTAASNLLIRGPGADRLAISGNGLTRVFAPDGDVTMSGVTIRDGNTTRQTVFNRLGAGISNDGRLTLNDCVITNNSGAGIHNSGIMVINRCTISNNTAFGGNSAVPTVISRGAGIENRGSLTISHSTIANNEGINDDLTDESEAIIAGGILSSGRELNIIGCTISGNGITGSARFPAGGGIANRSTTSSPLITDTVIAGNRSPAAPDCRGAFTSGGYNLIGDKTQSTGFEHGVNRDQVGGAGCPVIDARLGPLADNGGSTFTMALLDGSPAIDQGVSALATDQRGAARRSDFASIANADGGDGSDVGAFELNAGKPAALLNISTRAEVQQGNNVMIGGFIITGSDPKNVLLRAIGPSLTGTGVQGALQNPTMDLFQSGTLLATNDDWKQTQRAEIEATGIPPRNDAESAIVRQLSPGSYTAVVQGVNNQTGIALVEAYDLDQAAFNSQLANISTRASVQTGEKVLIGGFIVGPADGDNSTIVIRAIGPSLTSKGVAGALQDPTVELNDANGSVIAANDNWKDSQQADIAASGIAPDDDREAAILRVLGPGNYTAVVRGKNDSVGVALVEAYNLGAP